MSVCAFESKLENMSDLSEITNIDDNSSLYEILKHCASFQSYDSLPIEDFSDTYIEMMMSRSQYSVSGNSSTYSYTSEDSLGENILEENGRISLAYENLKTIPKKIAEKFGAHTQFLDLSYNNFQNLSFLSFFEDLHTLILDRNIRLDVNTLPFMPNLKILWINNCDIKNIVEWIQRIAIQCPNLQYLSIMGNSAIYESIRFDNFNMLNNSSKMEATIVDANMFGDYSEYILKMLPNLQYLDGVRQVDSSVLLQCSANGALNLTSSSPSPYTPINTSPQSQHTTDRRSRKVSPALNFKDLLLLKRRKISYPDSSSN